MKNNTIDVEKLSDSIFLIKNLFSSTDCDKFSRSDFFKECNKVEHAFGQQVEGYEIRIIDKKEGELLYLRNMIVTFIVPELIKIIKEINPNILSGIFDLTIQSLSFRKITGETLRHIDQIGGKYGSRLLSVIIALNDDYDGGIISFPNQHVNIKLKKGEILIFPPYWTHPHKVSSPQNNCRYTITFWLLNNDNCDVSVDDEVNSDLNDEIEEVNNEIKEDFSILSDIDSWSQATDDIDIGSDYFNY